MNSVNDAPVILGSTIPRIYTPPLRKLTPETSYGFDVIEFADEILGEPLDPWQQWAIIHAGELLPDGRPRFRTVLILVARQNGKTHLLRALTLFWLFVEEWPVILGLSTDRSYAKKTLHKVSDTARRIPELRQLLPVHKNLGLNGVIGEESLSTASGCEYMIAATNRRAGRSLSIDRLVIDEIREHHSWDAWDACTKAMNARPFGQTFCITNQGDDTSVVLDSLRNDAVAAIDSGDTVYRTGIFEWSGHPGSDLLDEKAVAQANPNLGRRVFFDDLRDDLARAKRNGGEEESRVRTEVLCERVRALTPAIDPGMWARCADPGVFPDFCRLALVVDVSMDQLHATAYAAAVVDDRVRIDLVKPFRGPDCVDQLRQALPDLVDAVKPKVVGWLPGGPAASLSVDLRRLKGTEVVEIKSDLPAVSMGFAELVTAGKLAHSNDTLLNSQIAAAEKQKRGDTWVFSRRGGHCDAVYAAAGAAHLARTLPPSVGKPRIITV